MDSDTFSRLLLLKVCDSKNRNTCQNITLDLVRSAPIEQNRYWWTGRALQLCEDKDMNGWHLAQADRLRVRSN